MSKYSFTSSPSRWRQFDVALPLVALAISLACLPEAAKSYVPDYSLALAWLSVAVATLCWRLRLPTATEARWQLSVQGDIALSFAPFTEQTAHWRLSAGSRIAWWGVFIVLKQRYDDQQKRLWLLKGEVSEQNYRRLCRQIIQNEA